MPNIKPPPRPKDNTAAIAAQFGVSLKALRLYEQLGMLKPPRTAAGWRVFGRADIERLHAILSLKQLGLPLARIAELFKTDATDLAALLSVQEQMLQEIRRETDHALALVKIAKARVRKKQNLSAEELSAMVRNISGAVVRMTPELEALARRVYTPEQFEKFNAREQSGEDASRLNGAWARIYEDVDAMLPKGDPVSKKGLAIARRAVALIQESTRGDKALWNNAYHFWREAVADPRTAAQMPMKQAHWDFMAKAFVELKRHGEMKP